jgi:tetratricopeptide (TPR) repeat protein
VLALVAAMLCCSPASQAEPFVPQDDAQVLERLPYQPGSSPAAELRAQREALASNPDNLALATETARTYIAKGRATGDPRYFGYAQAALEPWWDAPDAPAEILVLRADVKQASHDFAGALRDLNHALRKNPGDLNALLTRAIILQVQGRYDQAQRDCAALLQAAQKTPSLQLTALTCAASVASFNGQAARSFEVLERALQASAGTQGTSWALSTLADIAARLGRVQAAQRYFKAALALEESAWLLGAYADFLLAQRRPAQVIALLEAHTDNDTLLLLLALAEQQVNAPQLDEHVAMLRARFAAARLRRDQRHLREEARFALELLDQPQQALRLARQNWRVQREPEDARMLLAAALAADKPKAARPVLKFLKRTSLEDRRLEALCARLQRALPA